MTVSKMVFSLVMCLLLSLLIGQTPAQIPSQSGAVDRASLDQPQINPEQMKRQIEAEAAERSKQLAAEREQRRGQMLKDMQQRGREVEKQRDESIKLVLRATDQQWEVIFPRFDKVRTLMRQARYNLATVGYSSGTSSGGSQKSGGSSSTTSRSSGSGAGAGAAAGGSTGGAAVGGNGWRPLGSTDNKDAGIKSQSGWKWARPSENKGRSELTPAERAAENLLDGLENPQSRETDIRERLAALRKIRDEAAGQLPKAQQELREVLTFDQEAKLVLMGYLE